MVPLHRLIAVGVFIGQQITQVLSLNARQRQQQGNGPHFEVLGELLGLVLLAVVFTLDTAFPQGDFLSKIFNKKP